MVDSREEGKEVYILFSLLIKVFQHAVNYPTSHLAAPAQSRGKLDCLPCVHLRYSGVGQIWSGQAWGPDPCGFHCQCHTGSSARAQHSMGRLRKVGGAWCCPRWVIAAVATKRPVEARALCEQRPTGPGDWCDQGNWRRYINLIWYGAHSVFVEWITKEWIHFILVVGHLSEQIRLDPKCNSLKIPCLERNHSWILSF